MGKKHEKKLAVALACSLAISTVPAGAIDAAAPEEEIKNDVVNSETAEKQQETTQKEDTKQETQKIEEVVKEEAEVQEQTVTEETAQEEAVQEQTVTEDTTQEEENTGTGVVTQNEDGTYTMENEHLKVTIGKFGQIESLKITNDDYDTDYVFNAENFPKLGQSATHQWMGELMFSIKTGDGEYKDYYTSRSNDYRQITLDGDKVVITYENTAETAADKVIDNNLKVVETYEFVDNKLKWSTTLTNTSGEEMTVADWGMPMPFNELLPNKDANNLYENRVVDHSFVGGDSSYIYAIRTNGKGQFMMFSPDASTGAKLEYCDRWNSQDPAHSGDESAWSSANGDWVSGLSVYYIHSDNIKKTNSGYLENTSLTLQAGESKTYSFNFTPVESEADMRSELYKQDLVDIVAVPGFAFSKDMPAKVYVHANVPQEDISLEIQCPHELNYHQYDESGETNVGSQLACEDNGTSSANFVETVTYNGETYHVYELTFKDLGQNNLVVNYNIDGVQKQTTAQFYIMDSVANMLQQHAQFMVDNTQLDREGKTGNKLFDEWYMQGANGEGSNRIDTFKDPDEYFQMSYWGWGDDWGATQVQFLAEKNAYMPDSTQIEALDAYLDVAVWNELMREHQQDYIVHNFLMEAPNVSPIYRGYAYPHLYNTFFSMYKIAKAYPDMVEYREEAETYLLRACEIFITQNTSPDVAYGRDCGTMGESSVPDIIAALQEEGYYDEANQMLEVMKDSKYDFFENRLYPYGSEYTYDNTAEEGVYAAAKLAQEYGWYTEGTHVLTPEERISDLDAKTRACRGFQPLWYFYANPVTINGEGWWNFQYTMSLAAVPMDDQLRYQNNGWSDELKAENERVNYAAKLGNLTCVNSGQINSDPASIGTVAWIYQSEMGDYAETGDTLYNGWRHRAGESGLNLFGAIRILSADVSVDPVFGVFGYGCNVIDGGNTYTVTPLDGLQSRLNFINEGIYFELNRDQYTTATVNKDGSGFTMNIDSFMDEGNKHDVEIDVYGLQAGDYKVTVGDFTGHFTVTDGETSKIVVPVDGAENLVTVTQEAAAKQLEVKAVADVAAVDQMGSAVSNSNQNTFDSTNENFDETFEVSDTIELHAQTIMDGAFKVDDVTYTWTCDSDKVTFADSDKAVAKANVTEAGEYTFKVVANAGESTVQSEVKVTVNPDPEMKEVVGYYTFEDDTIDGKNANGENINNTSIVNSVGDTMGKPVFASNFLKTVSDTQVSTFRAAQGKAVQFTGDIKGGYLEFDTDILDRLTNATISMDIKLANNQVSNTTLLDFCDKLKLYFTGMNTLNLQVGDKSTKTTLSVAKGYWKNIALTVSGDTYTLYIDGNECAKLENTGVNLSDITGGRYLVGRSSQETSPFLNGLMDNLQIRSKALTAEEIKGEVGEIVSEPAEATPSVAVTKVNTAPELPTEISVLYTDGFYKNTAVTWDEVSADKYDEVCYFTVNGHLTDYPEIETSVTVYVVETDEVQLEQLVETSADSIMGNTSTQDPPSILITRPEPTNSGDFEIGCWHNWGTDTQNKETWVSYSWDTEKIVSSSEAYFFKDGNDNFFPSTYNIEYLDKDGNWVPVNNKTDYNVVLDGYSTVEFDPVYTTAIRLNMTPSKDGTGILKWKVNGWDISFSLDTARANELVNLCDYYEKNKANGNIIGSDEVFTEISNAKTAAQEKIKELSDDVITTGSQLKELQGQIDAVCKNMSDAMAKLEAKDGNLAYLANVSYSFISSWENKEASNDGIINTGVNPDKPRHGTWGNSSAFETATYTWGNKMELGSTNIQFWTDNGGILPPAKYEFYARQDDGSFKLVGSADGIAQVDTLLETKLANVVTDCLQVKMYKQANDANGVGIMEWQVFGASEIVKQPVSVEVRQGETATFTVTAKTEGATFQWQKLNGEEWQNIEGATANTYTIVNTTTDITGTSYRCVVTAKGEVTNSDVVTLTVLGEAVVTSVTVSPETAVVRKGYTKAFTAEVVGENKPDTTVTWSVTGANSEKTTISDTGVLTVGADESAEKLTVTATSTVTDTVFGTATVTVSDMPSVTKQNIKLYYEFENTSGSEVKDYSANNITGAITGTPEWNNGLVFSGDDYITLADGANVISPNMTFVFEVTRTGDITDDDAYSLFWGKNNQDYAGNGIYINTPDANQPIFLTGDGFNAISVTGNRDEFYPLNEKVQVTITLNSLTGEWAVYRNGQMYQNGQNGALKITAPNAPTNTIGASGYITTDPQFISNMTMSKYMIFNADLSASDVAKVYAGEFDADINNGSGGGSSSGGSSTTIDEEDIPLVENPTGAVELTDGKPVKVEKDNAVVEITADKTGTGYDIKLEKVEGTLKDGVLIALPTTETSAGTVAVMVDLNGKETVVKNSYMEDGKLVLVVDKSCKIKIEDRSKSFTDVSSNYWGKDAIAFATSHDLFNGTSETEFSPEGKMNRAMIVTVLARLAGEDTTSGSTWYEAGVNWAKENGISDGTNLNASVSREQLATMLYRYAGSPKVNGAAQGFTDSNKISSWATDAMNWAINEGLISGMGDGTVNPQGEATRAQVATIIQRFIMN